MFSRGGATSDTERNYFECPVCEEIKNNSNKEGEKGREEIIIREGREIIIREEDICGLFFIYIPLPLPKKKKKKKRCVELSAMFSFLL